tara:strand:+ start:18790 stop:19155 length:366 start_codon:yes stop_codon:yes gene_type:complete
MFLSILYLLVSNPNNNFYTRKTSIIDVDMNYNEYFSKPINYSAGYDCRFMHHSMQSKKEKEELQRISIHFKQQNLLYLLKNNDLSIFEKIDLIEKYDILYSNISSNIFNAGLLDDWEFNIL